MGSTKPDPNPLILPPPSQPPQLHHYNHPHHHLTFHLPPCWDPPLFKKLFKTSLLILAVATTLYALYPSTPNVEIVRLRLHHVKVHTHPRISLDVSLDTIVRVTNKAFFSMDYNTLHVAIGYRGKELGHVISGGGHVRGSGSSYVEVRVEFIGVEVIWELIHLVEDLSKGFIEFDTITQVVGSFGYFSFLQIPLKAKISCEIVVNMKLQTLTGQNCYPELKDAYNT